MRAIVIQNPMHSQAWGDVGFDGIQKLSKCPRSVALMPLSDDFARLEFNAANNEVGPCRR